MMSYVCVTEYTFVPDDFVCVSGYTRVTNDVVCVCTTRCTTTHAYRRQREPASYTMNAQKMGSHWTCTLKEGDICMHMYICKYVNMYM